MKKRAGIGWLVLSLLLAFTLTASCAKNLVGNESFEEVEMLNPYNNGTPRVTGWNVSGSGFSKAWGSVDTYAHTGKRSFLLGPMKEPGDTFWQVSPAFGGIKPGATYKVTVYVKAENTELSDGTFGVNAHFDITLYWLDKRDARINIGHRSERFVVKEETDWIQYTFETVAPEGASKVASGVCRRTVGEGEECAGNLYFDDYILTIE